MGKRQGKKALRAAAGPDVYPNSPLAEVVFELRFPGEPAVECRRDEYYATIRGDFPYVWVPDVEVGKPTALQPYQFKSEGDTHTVMAAINRFAYSTKRYDGFARFKPRALELAAGFCDRFGIRKLNRIGLRYINIIPFVRDAGHIPWQQYFTVRMSLPASAFDCLTGVSIAYEAKRDVGTITARIACVRSDKAAEAFLLDFDFAKTEAMRTDGLSAALQEAHDETKRVFQEIVSDQYKAVMRGEAIE
ncbi:MAG: TIGR04255 family protein [Planctomycetota bacterium]